MHDTGVTRSCIGRAWMTKEELKTITQCPPQRFSTANGVYTCTEIATCGPRSCYVMDQCSPWISVGEEDGSTEDIEEYGNIFYWDITGPIVEMPDGKTIRLDMSINCQTPTATQSSQSSSPPEQPPFPQGQREGQREPCPPRQRHLSQLVRTAPAHSTSTTPSGSLIHSVKWKCRRGFDSLWREHVRGLPYYSSPTSFNPRDHSGDTLRAFLSRAAAKQRQMPAAAARARTMARTRAITRARTERPPY